ncbi:AAA domain-containing protein [Clostridium aestuarii]|uniref:AAA domain-containing protein n=1 Tax=Clostridium aestuarii TaxID=338193 RepID=A0ABT4D1E1_9CLOT|nr:AAA domain-containing protein [Clostridium aestuarii]MCY6485058.1 AAA domain-containing protein [Clostridium aestuarii]
MEDNNSKDKLIKLFTFLKQYNDIKNPVVVDIDNQVWKSWMDSIPVHDSIVNNIYSDKIDEDIILSVRRPELKQCPPIPAILVEWVKKGWRNVDDDIQVLKELKVLNPLYEVGQDDKEKYVFTKFEDDENRVKELENWKIERDEWIKNEKPARESAEFFNKMYSLYSDIQKQSESVELMIGDGILFYSNKKFIEHPVLLQSVKMQFNADIPEFVIIPSDKEPEIYNSLFYNIDDINLELLKDVSNDLQENEYSPIEVDKSNLFLNRVALSLSSKGKLVNSNDEIEKGVGFPQIYRRPVLFLRKRNLGFGVAIDSIIEDMNINDTIPGFLKDIVGCSEEDNCKNSPKSVVANLDPNGLDKNILLTKPANSEQLAVAKHLERKGAVLVQGPPGTGKTHTIANMIGHILAQGKSILVTSYSEKALSVLKEKVVKNLQSLCLSLLSTTESRQEMEKTLDKINENRSRLDPVILKKEIDELERTRKYNIDKLHKLRNDLKNARLNEYRPIVIGGEEYKPVDAAKFIKMHKEEASWIPVPVELGVLPSLSNDEILELYKTNKSISVEEEREYDFDLPNIDNLLTPAEFKKLIKNKQSFSQTELKKNFELWGNNTSEYSREDLKNIVNDINKALDYINLEKEWTLASIEDGKEEVLKQQWENLIKEIDEVYETAVNTSEIRIEFNPEFISLQENIDTKKCLDDIIARLESGGKIGRFSLMLNSRWKKTINSCRVNTNYPKNLREFEALRSYYELLCNRKKLKNRWDRQVAVLGADSSEKMGENFEQICKKYCNTIHSNIEWYKKIWQPIIEKLKCYGLDVESIDNEVDLSADRFSRIRYIKTNLSPKLIETMESEIYRIDYEKYKAQYESLEGVINKYPNKQTSVILKGLQDSLTNEDVELYQDTYETLVHIKTLGKTIERRKKLIDKLKKTANAWAEKIEDRNGIHGEGKPLENIKEAWIYRQLCGQIEVRNSLSIENIQGEILESEKYLKENTAELAFKKAWSSKLLDFENNKQQVQAIEGWRQLIRKIGSGKGKRAEALKAEARKLMPLCQTAVPVWIMPLNKVVENFNPSKNKFDVVIIDEASQADIMALVALYLGKKVIIVGDNEQVSPLAIGEKTEDIERLSKEFLYEVPNHFLYSGKFSIYDLAQTAGYQPVRLREHFRCVPDIIQYSNMLSYNGQIKPLRETSNVKTRPATISYKVDNAISVNKTNEKEADAVVSLILACCEMEEYNDKTFGVITLRGDKQAAIIDKMLQSKMEPAKYRNRNILCGNPANFQGDERDIIFLSMVDTNEGEGPIRLNGYGTDNLYKKRYNVAVSRAKDQIWLVHSIDSENDLKPGDIRKELIDYIKNPKSRENAYNLNVNKAESEFEKRVMKYLTNKGYKIVPQWEVGSYRIDMVAVYKENKVAIECDGEKWHGEDKLEEDMLRQAILERLGWRFIRIRGSEFFKNEIGTMEMIYEKLTDMEIYTDTSNYASEENETYDLKEIIISRAEQIRREWKEE